MKQRICTMYGDPGEISRCIESYTDLGWKVVSMVNAGDVLNGVSIIVVFEMGNQNG